MLSLSLSFSASPSPPPSLPPSLFPSLLPPSLPRFRNYFAFVVRESGKYQCHVFLEADTDAATIVTTIQRMLAPEPVKKR